MKRNPSVELMRIIACFIVLSCHCNFTVIVDNPASFHKMYLASLLGDPVTIFWMITGFFLFNNTDYKKLWKHTFTKILVPLLLLYVLDFFISNFVLGRTSFADSFIKSGEDYYNFFYKLFSLHAPTELSSAHTWYVLAYVLIILCYPILKAFVDYLDKDKKREITFIVISILLWILNDLYINELFDFTFHGAGVLVPAAIEIIWGHIIYRHRDIFTKWYYIIIGPIAFFGINLIRTFIQAYREGNLIDTGHYIFRWSSIFAVVCAICVIAFCFSLIKSDKVSFINKAICTIASYTYGIYLIHVLVQEEITKLGYFTMMREYLITKVPEWACTTITVYAGGILLFVLCIIICIVLRLLKKLLFLPYTLKKRKAD